MANIIKKATKEAANYREAESEYHSCLNCVHFDPDPQLTKSVDLTVGTCSRVAGRIDSNHVSDIFKAIYVRSNFNKQGNFEPDKRQVKTR